MIEGDSHRKFRFAIVILAIVAIASLVTTAWTVNELNAAQKSRLLVDDELVAMQAELEDLEIELNASKALVESLEDELSNLQVNYARLTTGYGYVLRDPSYQEMKDFLKQDKTDKQEYSESDYVCVDFAADVKANAAKEGLRCAYVAIEYLGRTGHTIVAFDTSDRGLVYIEPQFDWEVEPEIGRRYYQCVKPPAGHYMTAPSYDDTIARIIVIW
jgi:cell division protein FtsB